MIKEKLRVNKKLIALLVAGGITLLPLTGTIAEKKYVEGTFVKEVEMDENEEFGQYVVMEGDTLSKISEKYCGHYKQEVTTKLWPSFAFLNGYPKVSNPGDIIIFFKDYNKQVELNEKLRKTGWTAKYITQNNIYGKKAKIKYTGAEVRALLEAIYGDDVCVDRDFVITYLEMHPSGNLTESIPTVEEIYIFQRENAPKTKKKR